MKTIAATVVISGGMIASSYSLTVAQWTFESSQPTGSNQSTLTGLSPEFGSGEASGVHASSDTDWSHSAGNGSSESFSSNNWTVGDYCQFRLSTVRFDDIGVAFGQGSSVSGPSEFDLGAITALNNATTILSRLANNSTVSVDGGTVLASGAARIDNFTVTGTAIQSVPSHWSSGCTILFLTGLTGAFGWIWRMESMPLNVK